jgi:hypothetical protein
MVSALFVQAAGCYSDLPYVDPWDQIRDARKYAGPFPVVAHPPCQLWGNLAAVNFARYGGAHNKPGNDGGCFRSALLSVRRFSGVLEHPANSRAFFAFDLGKPQPGTWQRSADGVGWITAVWQSAYGHRANKATWLYYVGRVPHELDWRRLPGTHQIGFQDRRGKALNKPTLGKREANATPIRFRNELLALALASRGCEP